SPAADPNSPDPSTTCDGLRGLASDYGWMAWIRARARCWGALAVVSNSKVGAFSPALGVRQVLRTRMDRSAIKVAPRTDSPHETQ
ncbi:MAG: hypothetical protein KDF63_03545, partial [Rhodoferax sp.]|nr:hypothetical protein [Rhodoferax sp.]